MNLIVTPYHRLKQAAYILFGITLGIMLLQSPYLAWLIVLGLFTVVLLSKSPFYALFIFIIFIPYSSTELFNEYVIDLPGARLINILGFLVVAAGIWHHKNSEKLPTYAFYFITAIFVIFTIGVFRSLSHLDQLMQLADDIESTHGYLLSHYVKPLLYFIPTFVIIKYAKGKKQLEFVVNILVFSAVAFALYLLFLFLFKSPDKNELARDYMTSILKIHGNAIATFLLVAFPIVLARYFTRQNLISAICLVLTIAAIGITYSRTAYLTLLFSLLAYLILSERAKLLPFFLVAVFALSFTIFTSVKERATHGFKSREYNEIFAGRIDGIWLPLWDEYSKSAKKMLIGNGRYSIKVSDSANRGYLVSAAGHPHNMYMEAILDAGILGLIVFVSFYYILLKKTFKNLKRFRFPELREYQFAVLVSLMSFLIAGLTGRSFFPRTENSFIWLVIGITIALNRIVENSGESVAETAKNLFRGSKYLPPAEQK